LNSYQIKTVKRIVDGDTYDLLIDLGFGAALDIRVRLLGVDTPELRGQTKEKGKAASRAVSEFFAQYMTKNQTTIDRGYEFKATAAMLRDLQNDAQGLIRTLARIDLLWNARPRRLSPQERKRKTLLERKRCN